MLNRYIVPELHTTVYSFDGTDSVSTTTVCPDRYNALFAILDNKSHISIQGGSLSLPLATAAKNSITVQSLSFNRILSFSPNQNLITVEGGIRIGDLLAFLVKNNKWISPLPGYPSITVGGCIGFNVHGKGKGYFSETIDCLTFYHPRYGELTASAEKNEDLFNLTLGGMGATGFITSVTLKTTALKGVTFKKKRIPVDNLIHAVQLMSDLRSSHDQVYSWHNLVSFSDDSFGKGYIYLEDFSRIKEKKSRRKYRAITSQNRGSHPAKLAKPLMGKHINYVYNFFEKCKSTEEILNVENGAFPISGKEVYYHLFGKRGYREYQASIPQKNWEYFASELKKICQNNKPDITLGSLKIFNRTFDNYINFCHQGVILAINAVSNRKTLSFFNEMDRLVVKYQGLPNIYKDSRISREIIRTCYKDNYHNFVKDLSDFDESHIFTNSHLQRILE